MEEQRVTFRFVGVDSQQVHYMSGLPEVGNLVTHEGVLWIVESISVNGNGMIVRCEPASSGESNGPGPFTSTPSG